MATLVTARPVVAGARPAPDPKAPVLVEAARPAPTVLRALSWNEAFGPWVEGRHNFRPVIAAALAQARSRAS